MCIRDSSDTISADQAFLDSDNRKKVDELFETYGFPTESDNVLAVWLVMHHSTDCDYAYKWLDLFIENYEKGYTSTADILPTYRRFFADESGYCNSKGEYQLLRERMCSLFEECN